MGPGVRADLARVRGIVEDLDVRQEAVPAQRLLVHSPSPKKGGSPQAEALRGGAPDDASAFSPSLPPCGLDRFEEVRDAEE